MTKRRVLHLASIRWNSAIAEYALSSARALASLEHPTKMVLLEQSPLMLRAESHKLDVIGFPSFAMTQVLRLRTVLADFNPDVIISHGGPETILAGFACVGKTSILRVRGYAVDSSGILTGLTHDLGQLGVKGLIAPSTLIAHDLKQVSRIKAAAIPLGVDTERFYPNGDYVPAVRPSLVLFGRFDPVKGHREFMKIFRLMLNRWPGPLKPQLQVVGEPANISVRHLEEFAALEGLTWNDDIIVTSERVADVRELLASATVGIISSIGSEIICRVAEEFLLCGTPVFVSGAGSLKEVLVHESMGICYDRADYENAALQLTKALTNFAQESVSDRQARSTKAHAEFSIKTMAHRLEAFMEDVL